MKAPTTRSACSRWRAPRCERTRSAGGFARPAARGLRRDRRPRRAFPMAAHVCEVEIDPETGIGRDRQLRGGRRCRARREPADHSRPGPWRHRPGRRPGADGACLYDPAKRPTARRLVHGLRHAAGLGFSVLRHRAERGALDHHPLGIRPAGEGGTVPALAVVVNAIVDACPSSACATSKCRRRRNASGARFDRRATPPIPPSLSRDNSARVPPLPDARPSRRMTV